MLLLVLSGPPEDSVHLPWFGLGEPLCILTLDSSPQVSKPCGTLVGSPKLTHKWAFFFTFLIHFQISSNFTVFFKTAA